MVTRKFKIALRVIVFILLISPAHMSSQTNWQAYYPLHIGDFWEYQGYANNIPITITETVLRDTLMPNGFTYKIVRYKEHDGPFPHENFTFRRIDTLGRVCYYRSGDCQDRLVYKLNGLIGDTLKNSCNPNDPSFWKLTKRELAIVFNDTTETQTWGLFSSPLIVVVTLAGEFGLIIERGEFWERYLRGAIIKGQKHGNFTVSVEKNQEPIAQTFILYQNYPNPFNSQTVIRYSLNRSAQVRFVVYDVLGREVKIVAQGYQRGGDYNIVWNAKDVFGKPVPSGVYYLKLFSDQFTSTIKMLLIK